MRTSKVQAVATVIVVWPSPPVVVIGFGLAENRVTSQPGALGGTVSCWVLRVSTNRNRSIAREGGEILWSNCDHASPRRVAFQTNQILLVDGARNASFH